MRATLLAILVGVMALLMPVAATATSPANTCAGAVDAAEAENDDWQIPDPSPDFHFIVGNTISSIAELGKAVATAKQGVVMVVGGNFVGWDFRGSPTAMSGICFVETNLSGSNWEGVDGFGNGFIESNLSGANFVNAKLDHIILLKVNLAQANMTGAKLSNGSFAGGWQNDATNWNLTRADMTGFRFICGITLDDGCPLDRDGMTMAGASLAGADISTFYLDAASYAGAIIDRTTISPSQIGDLAQANVAGSVLLAGGNQELLLDRQEWLTVAAARVNHDAPSFDCARAASTVEKMICGDDGDHLRVADRQMAGLYGVARVKDKGVVTSQKRWLAMRAACKDEDCLTDAYDTRVAALALLAGQPPVPANTADALYIEEVVHFTEAFRRTPLFARLKPVLVGASMAKAVVTRNDNGSYSTLGAAVGANAHTCTLAADGLTLDGKSGWHGMRDGSNFVPVLRFVGDEMEVIGGGMAPEDHPGADQYASCGMRARFGPMRRIEVDAETMEREMQALSAEYGES